MLGTFWRMFAVFVVSAKSQNCKLQCFGSWHSPQKQQTSAKKYPTWTSKKRLVILSPFFRTPDPKKYENTTIVNDFWGGFAGRGPPAGS
jgi:hypothetical protein